MYRNKVIICFLEVNVIETTETPTVIYSTVFPQNTNTTENMNITTQQNKQQTEQTTKQTTHKQNTYQPTKILTKTASSTPHLRTMTFNFTEEANSTLWVTTTATTKSEASKGSLSQSLLIGM